MEVKMGETMNSKSGSRSFLDNQEGEGVGVAAQAVPPPIPEPIPEPMPEPDQPQDHLSTPPQRQTNAPCILSPPSSTEKRGGETELKDSKKLFKDDVWEKLVKKAKQKEYNSRPKKTKGGFPTVFPTGVVSSLVCSTKGKTPMVEEDITVKERTLKQMEDDRLDWIDIMAQVHANAGLSSELLGADVNDDNFAERMVALINQRKRAFAEQTAKEKRDKPMTPAQQREYMRVCFLMSDSEDEALPILGLLLLVGCNSTTYWEKFNALYTMDQSTKHFTTLREILHMVDRHDILKLYGLVSSYYENQPVDGARIIRSWRLYTLSNVYVLETVLGEVLYMFADVTYPLLVKLMERMLKQKLEINKEFDQGTLLLKSTHVAAVVPKSVAGLRFSEGSSLLLTFDVQVQQGYED
ncbi:hypothetical protein Tco_0546335 [Tanacetum coccineum]